MSLPSNPAHRIPHVIHLTVYLMSYISPYHTPCHTSHRIPHVIHLTVYLMSYISSRTSHRPTSSLISSPYARNDCLLFPATHTHTHTQTHSFCCHPELKTISS